GYAFLTADPATAERYRLSAEESERLGAGELRVHRGRSGDPPFPPHHAEGWPPELVGADLVLDPALIRQRLPFITADAIAMLHPRPCGGPIGVSLGLWLLGDGKARGARLRRGRATAIDTTGGGVNGVTGRASGQDHPIQTRVFVNAAGPLIDKVG